MQPPSAPDIAGVLLSLQTGQARPLMVGRRKLVSAIGKTFVNGSIEIGVMGLSGDEQADLTVQSGRCGFYLAVDKPGRLQAGASFQVIAGHRLVSVAQALQHKAWKHLR